MIKILSKKDFENLKIGDIFYYYVLSVNNAIKFTVVSGVKDGEIEVMERSGSVYSFSINYNNSVKNPIDAFINYLEFFK
jgi:hypothetical protein